MSDGYTNGHSNGNSNVPALFDMDHSAGTHLQHHASNSDSMFSFHNHIDANTFSHHDLFAYDDPLKHAHQYRIKPIQLDTTHFHFTNPHMVRPTVTMNGDLREGYYRDGDGNSQIDNPFGGFYKANP